MVNFLFKIVVIILGIVILFFVLSFLLGFFAIVAESLLAAFFLIFGIFKTIIALGASILASIAGWIAVPLFIIFLIWLLKKVF